MFLRVGTGTSMLSAFHTNLVCERLKQFFPDLDFEHRTIRPKGNESRSLHLLRKNQAEDREIFKAVLDGRVDFVVRSLREILVLEEDPRLTLGGVPERGSPYEVLVSKQDLPLRSLRSGSAVGVVNPIRISQLRRVRADLKTKDVRGTVESRLRKVQYGEIDATILAESGLARLGIIDRISDHLTREDFVPSPGQGIISAIARRDNKTALDILSKLDHLPTRREAEAERHLVRTLAKTRVPIGALASAAGDRLQIMVRALSPDGKEMIQAVKSGSPKDPRGLARGAAEDLLSNRLEDLETGWRKYWT